MVYIRKIVRRWRTKTGDIREKSYYYWYKSRRIGDKVISECMGRATEEEYLKTHSDKLEAEKAKDQDEISNKRPTVKTIS